MNYELAKKLKDAGFVIKEPHEHIEGCMSDGVCSPTLSELIETMPMRRKDLGTINDAHFLLRKLVSFTPAYRAAMEDEDNGNYIEGYNFEANTPEEAVANLWLALNKK